MSNAVDLLAGCAQAQPAPPPRHGSHVDTVIACTVVLLSGIIPGAAFMALLTVPFVGLWLLFQVVLAAFKPHRWRYLAIKVAAMGATIAALIGCQAIYAPLARSAADEARQAVLAWHSANGQWPRTLDQAGFHDGARVQRWRIRYLGDGAMMYASTFDAHDRFYRRPDDADWAFRPD